MLISDWSSDVCSSDLEVRKSEARLVKMPTAVRWAVLKAKEKNLTAKQEAALAELEARGLLTGVAWQIREKLRWVRIAPTPLAVKRAEETQVGKECGRRSRTWR